MKLNEDHHHLTDSTKHLKSFRWKPEELVWRVQCCMLSIISRFTSCSFLRPKTTVCERGKDTHVSSGGTADTSCSSDYNQMISA